MSTDGGRSVLGSALRALVSVPPDAPTRNMTMLLYPMVTADCSMQDFRKLRAWQENRLLTVRVYEVTAGFPTSERFGLASQMRRCVVSIGANIAEGCGCSTTADTLRFLQMAFGSCTELLHHLIISSDLGFLSAAQSANSIRRSRRSGASCHAS